MVYDLKSGESVQEDDQRESYHYLREMARVGGKPKMVSERYLGSTEDIAAAIAGRDAASLPERTRHRGFGGVGDAGPPRRGRPGR
jgi:hypothetical protein